MSDASRKDISDKIADKVTPDKSKSTVDKVGDKTTGAADKVARDAVPDSQKSTTQSAADKASRTGDESDNMFHPHHHHADKKIDKKVDIADKKADIADKKADVADKKADLKTDKKPLL
ncbi:hypothetical protein CBER1_04218 [Cercospora berteroae]|uniref:Uncharacterized protein n=1 Tax=Cercospora berteroae TaxID=357750 RepID=A0A2S6CHX2_9PEZI|nr:hypothetical protein CBER1_04218 [Cercospora berteroae]